MEDYEPIPISAVKPLKGDLSEREIVSEIDKMAVTLVDIQTASWDKRSQAMQRLQSILISPAAETGTFLSAFSKLTGPLSAQINDLRSAIVGEASKTISLSAQILGQRFEAFADKFIHGTSLFKALQIANKIMAEHAHRSIQHIIHNVVAPKIIPKICEEIKSKNTYSRAKSAHYIGLILALYPEEVLRRSLSQIEDSVFHSISDANPDCRMAGRVAYHRLKEIFPKRADQIFYRLDNAFQKVLQEEEKQLEAGIGISQAIMQSSVSRKMYEPSPKPMRTTHKSIGRPSSNTSGKMNRSAMDVPSAPIITGEERHQSSNKLLVTGTKRTPGHYTQKSTSFKPHPALEEEEKRSEYEEYRGMKGSTVASTPMSVLKKKRNSSHTNASESTHHLEVSGAPLFKGKRSDNLVATYSQAQSTTTHDEVSDTASLTSTQTMKKKPPVETHNPSKGKFNHTAEIAGKTILGDSKKGVIGRKPPTQYSKQNRESSPFPSTEPDQRSDISKISVGNFEEKGGVAQKAGASSPTRGGSKKTHGKSSFSGQKNLLGLGSTVASPESDFEDPTLYLMRKTSQSVATQQSSKDPFTSTINSTAHVVSKELREQERNFEKYRPPSKASLMKRKELDQLNQDREQQKESRLIEKIQNLMHKGDNPVWGNRVEAFDNLCKFTSNPEALQVFRQRGLFSKLIELIQSRVNDTHFKVSLSVMDCLSKFLQCVDFKDDLEPQVDEIIPKLLLNISDKKEKVSKSATLLIQSLRVAYGSDALLPSLIRVLQDNNENIKQKTIAVEVAVHLTKQSEHYFSGSSSHIRNCVNRVALLLIDNLMNRKFFMPAIGFLLALRDINKPVTIANICKIHQHSLAEIRALISKHALDFENDIREYFGEERITKAQMQRKSRPPSGKIVQSNSRSSLSNLESNRRAPSGGHSDVVSSRSVKANQQGQGGVRAAAPRSKDSQMEYYGGSGRQGGYQEYQKLSPKPRVQSQATVSAKSHLGGGYAQYTGTHNRHHQTQPGSLQTSALGQPNYFTQAQQGQQTEDEEDTKEQMEEEEVYMAEQQEEFEEDDDFNIVKEIIQEFYEDSEIHWDSLKAFQKLNNEIEIYDTTWQHFFKEIVKCVLKCTEEESPQINEFAWQVLKELIQVQPQRFPQVLDTIFTALVDPQGKRAVAQGAEEVLQQLISTQESEILFKSLGRLVNKMEHPALQKLIKLISRMVQVSNTYELQNDVHYIAQSLIDVSVRLQFQKFEHPVPEVRKAVVFALVEIHAKLGNLFEPYLESLSPSQQKLVTIYISRRSDRQKATR